MAIPVSARELAGMTVKRLRKFVIPTAKVLTLNATAIEIVPAVPRFVILPEEVTLFHPAGTAYTIAGGTRLNFRWNSGAGTIAMSALMNGFLDQAAAKQLSGFGPSSAAALLNELLSEVNVKLVCLLSAAATVGTSDLRGLIRYRLLPFGL